MRYQYYWTALAKQDLLDFLSKNKIKHDLYYERVSFSVYTSQPNYKELIDTITTVYQYSDVYQVNEPLIFAEYSEKDKESADFLWITPKKFCIDICNLEEAYQYSCAYVTPTCFGDIERVRHKKQIGRLKISKLPNLNTKTAFFAPDTGHCELFCDHRIKTLAEENCLSGISFLPVLTKKNIDSDVLFQLASPHILHISDLVRGYGEKSEFCFMCGKESIVLPTQYQLHLYRHHLDPSWDYVSTDNIFGEGISYPLHIISQRFYQLLKEHNLCNGLSVNPIVLHA